MRHRSFYDPGQQYPPGFNPGGQGFTGGPGGKGPGGKGPGGKGPGGKGGPPGGGGGGLAPTSPPPSFTPSQSQAYSLQGGGGVGGQAGAYAVAPITLRYCLFRYSYIWPTWGPGFWAWLIFVGRGTAAGFRWNGRRWVYFAMDTRQILAIYCY
ncbi:collagen-like protein [Fictibacillus phosphorivorans]|uniref:collagen-like protein n=1 Tax=Fictibacillus phosphorivorans TaxID=1221500 RepID=UPI002041BD53|nr:collagen-like protein [Fictibacillus phosphorivorans]MCM3718617.1 collagen-like protein [Fictibacillus phosphorivorans]MCM3776240.1 collagen-like protein [Fictibacillus phosphorivorans]